MEGAGLDGRVTTRHQPTVSRTADRPRRMYYVWRFPCERLYPKRLCLKTAPLTRGPAGIRIAASKTVKINLKQFEAWFVTGSQHLYGPETLKGVAKHSQEIARALNAAPAIPIKVVFKPVMVSPDAISALCLEANHSRNCMGLI